MPEPQLVIALDLPTPGDALLMAGCLQGVVQWLKVGLQLFIAAGPDLLAQLKKQDFKIFLDLKFYDIPNTVAGAVASAAGLGVDMLTLHLQGGKRMCESAVQALLGKKQPLLMGVTALTSFAKGEMPGIVKDPGEFGFELAGLANAWGLGGVVCSGWEVARIKSHYPGLVCLCPGIRTELSQVATAGESQRAKDDQRRVMTPQMAAHAGADYLVVGRPVLQAQDPARMAESISQIINA